MSNDAAYKVSQEAFTGPFDVLIKAIDEGQIDVYQVSLSQITASYFEYWRMESPDLVLASDFLIMAAYLIELKSKSLLPAKEEAVEEDLLENIEESLVAHIQEYEVYKNLAQTLRERKEIFEKVYGRHEGEPQEKEIELVDVSLKDLVLAFKRVYDEAVKREKVVPIRAEEVTLDQRVEEVRRLISGKRGGVQFVDIFIRKTRIEIVVTFLAVLELAKQRCIKIVQDRRYGSIIIFDRQVYEQDHGEHRITDEGTTDGVAADPWLTGSGAAGPGTIEPDTVAERP
ncbi:MAG: segregation/condensation protein A [Candidatus Saganbacteria bacterium]|nr:segregation/condensation protein A [Candidatus Saganbacteria bacterium]